ncbi:HXXEE domain-containing protein [Acidicapsa ligni]|uniref:HXXEE domain-containing protein n=1 Tax=Acidicapsa ligni TaxID=542300 RepID=UPI0021E0A6BB|nr:HXXEE domain-containing protein [Acidicapsa ligni]
MRWSWIDLNFPWIGSIGAVVVLVLLFSTNGLRSDFSRSRWRDHVWLSWLAVAIYLIHNVEEYGVDLVGQFHAFPNSMCSTLGLSPFPSCPIPSPFFLAVNLPLFWVGAPIAALMSRRHPIVGLSLYGVIFVNALSHLGAFVRAGYNPGVLTALILFLPASVWVAWSCFGRRGLPYRELIFIIVDGAILHIVLIGSTMLFLHGLIGPTGLTAIQILNAALFFALAWLAEKWRSGMLVRPTVT